MSLGRVQWAPSCGWFSGSLVPSAGTGDSTGIVTFTVSYGTVLVPLPQQNGHRARNCSLPCEVTTVTSNSGLGTAPPLEFLPWVGVGTVTWVVFGSLCMVGVRWVLGVGGWRSTTTTVPVPAPADAAPLQRLRLPLCLGPVMYISSSGVPVTLKEDGFEVGPQERRSSTGALP